MGIGELPVFDQWKAEKDDCFVGSSCICCYEWGFWMEFISLCKSSNKQIIENKKKRTIQTFTKVDKKKNKKKKNDFYYK